jgi:DNA-binding transcriptional MerR regulator
MYQLYSTTEAARLIGVTEFRLAYAHRAGHLAGPTYRIANKRIYTESDIERVTEYFRNRKHGDRQTEVTDA